MFVWVGVDLERQLRPLRQKIQAAEACLGLDKPRYTLPLHVSLKISFEVKPEQLEDVTDAICAYYAAIRPFEIRTEGLERAGNILWIPVSASDQLQRMHDDLDQLLRDKFGVPQHAYDKAYCFHITALMHTDVAVTEKAYALLRDAQVPACLRAEAFCVGISECGEAGTYRIYKRIYNT